MLKRYVFIASLVGFSASYGMKKEYIEDAQSLSQEKGLYFNLLPKDILGIVQYYRLAEIIELKIAQTQDYNQALEYVKALVKGDHPELFDNPTFIDSLLEKISSNFGADPEKVARDINTSGANLWRTYIRPNQIKLIYAAKDGDINTVQQLIVAGVNLSARSRFGDSALMWAALNGHVEAIKVLIAAGANLNAQNKDAETALMKAARQGHTEVVKILIKAGADVNAQNNNGLTALMWAAYGANAEMLKELIGAGANVNAQNVDGMTALMWAALKGHTEIVEELIAADADVTALDKYGQTALDIARNRGHAKIIKLLETAQRNKDKA